MKKNVRFEDLGQFVRMVKNVPTAAVALLFFVYCAGFSLVNAQTTGVSGTVTYQTGEPIPGVTVVVKGTTVGTSTDKDGKYSLLSLDKEAVLVFSFVGMKNQEIAVTGKSIVDAAMQEESNKLDEVVVVGYGTVQKKDLTGAVSTIIGKDIAERQSVRVSQALQGAVAGVMVTRGSGAPDASSTIKIRGVTTIGDSNPLVIIDGIPGTLDWVNPNDVESISVLKDAASASIYGSRAASGVIVVTTKRSKSGQLSLDYNTEFGIDKPTRIAKYADAATYMRIHNELKWNDNNNTGSEYPVFAKDLIDNYQSLHRENPDLYPDTDWIGSMLKNRAPRQSHSLNVNAGSSTFRTKVSLVYDKTGAFYTGRDYDRITVRANTDFTINKFLSLEVDLNGLYSINKHPSYDISPAEGVAPIYAALWSDGRVGEGKTGVNPYARMNYGGFNNTTSNVSRGKVALHFKPFDGLKISGIFSPELYNDKNKTFNKKLAYTGAGDPNVTVGYVEGLTQTSLNESRNESYNITSQLLANYTKTMGKHNLDLMVGNENYRYFSESLRASRSQYDLTSFPYLDLGNRNFQYNGGGAYENAYSSFFGRVMYNYNSRYFLQVNGRYDGSSRFNQKYRWGFFPSVSGGWVISDEKFIQPNRVLSFLKLRASWGTLGNERIGNYPYQSTIGFDNALFFQGGQTVAAQTAAIQRYAISNISWETTSSSDVGFDANFFNNRLSLTADYYTKTTRDMLLALEIPDYIGLENPDQNTGKMNTKGWEFELGWNDKINDLGYSVSFNLSDSRSVMGYLGGTQFLGSQVKFEGSQFNEWYGYRSEGLYQNQDQVDNFPKLSAQVKPGDVRYADISGPDGVPDGKISAEYDRVLLGGSLPRFLYGGNVRLNYRDFDFSLVVQGIGMQHAQATQAMIQPFRAEYIEVPQSIVGEYWTKYNTEEQNLKAKYPRVSSIGNSNNYAFSDYWLFNGAYLRLKNITLGYNIPKKIAGKLKLQNARIYLSGSDLLSLDHFPKGWDPEASTYWIPKSFIGGIALKF